MKLADLFKLAKPIVYEVEAKAAAVGATGAQKRDKAVQALSQQLADQVNERVQLPEIAERYTDELLGFAVDGVLDGLNSYVGKAWGSRLDLTHENGRTGLSFEITF